MDNSETDNNDTSSTSTQEPGDGRRAEGDAKEGLDEPLADEHVRTQEQRNQQWTTAEPSDSRRENEGEPLRTDGQPSPTMDMPDELEAKLDDVMAHPHSDAQETSESDMASGDLGESSTTPSTE